MLHGLGTIGQADRRVPCRNAKASHQCCQHSVSVPASMQESRIVSSEKSQGKQVNSLEQLYLFAFVSFSLSKFGLHQPVSKPGHMGLCRSRGIHDVPEQRVHCSSLQLCCFARYLKLCLSTAEAQKHTRIDVFTVHEKILENSSYELKWGIIE